MSLTHISVRGAREHNLKGVDDRPAARQADRDHRPVGHRASRASPSTPSMPRGSGAMSRACRAYARQFLELMQKPDVEHIEGLSPRDLDRAEDDQPQSALDGRHRHRDLRLHAPAVGARRHSLFARHRPADQRADRQPDGRPGDGAARGHARLPARAGRARPQGRVSQGARRVAEGRLHPRPHRRRDATRSRTRPRSTRSTSTTSRWWSTASRCARASRRGSRESFETALKLAEGLAYVDLVDATAAVPRLARHER